MARRPRRNHGPAFKAKVAVTAIKGEKTLIELLQDFDVHPNQIKQWHDQLLEGATGVFGDAPKADPEPAVDVKTLHAKIGNWRWRTIFVGRAGEGRSVVERKKMIDRTVKLSVSRQAVVLGISRGAVYYKPRPVSDSDLKPMNRIDRLHVAALTKRMSIEALYRKLNTSKPVPGHKIYPYLLRNLSIIQLNQVWAMDITYIPMGPGLHLSRCGRGLIQPRVLAWRVPITLEAAFCIEAVEEALAKYGTPEIFNTDQGSQFTSAEFIKVLAARGIRISMDGKSAWRDNVFVERLWRTIKYEEVYLHAYADGIGLGCVETVR